MQNALKIGKKCKFKCVMVFQEFFCILYVKSNFTNFLQILGQEKEEEEITIWWENLIKDYLLLLSQSFCDSLKDESII